MRDECKRLEFAEFLERLARDTDGPGEWFDLCVNHDHDDELEEIRRRLVRLAIERDPRAGRCGSRWIGSKCGCGRASSSSREPLDRAAADAARGDAFCNHPC